MIAWQKSQQNDVSLVGFDLVYSLFSLPLSLINVISHNVSQGFLLNCFLKVDGHQNFPQGRVCRELLVRSAYIAHYIWMCSHVLCVCVHGCTTMLMCIGPHMYSCGYNVYFWCQWPLRISSATERHSFEAVYPSVKGHILSRQNMLQNPKHLVIARSIIRAVKHMALCTWCLSYDTIYSCFIWYL